MSYLKRYIKDDEFRFTFVGRGLDVVNYSRINYMEDNKISLSYENGTFIVKGDNLRIQKLLDDEILIVGNIQNIELKG